MQISWINVFNSKYVNQFEASSLFFVVELLFLESSHSTGD